MKCSVVNSQGEGCPNDAHGTICGTHRSRLARHGDVLADVPIRHYTEPAERTPQSRIDGETEEERHWARVRKTDHHWYWTGATVKSGTGMSRLNGFSQGAPRVSWLLAGNAITETSKIGAVCGDADCVRPSHLADIAGFDEELRKLARELVELELVNA